MRLSGEEEYQRFLGFPASMWPLRKPGGHSDEDRRDGSVAALRHPIAWVRWRIVVRRHGPYAPDFQEFRQRSQPGG